MARCRPQNTSGSSNIFQIRRAGFRFSICFKWRLMSFCFKSNFAQSRCDISISLCLIHKVQLISLSSTTQESKCLAKLNQTMLLNDSHALFLSIISILQHAKRECYRTICLHYVTETMSQSCIQSLASPYLKPSSEAFIKSRLLEMFNTLNN